MATDLNERLEANEVQRREKHDRVDAFYDARARLLRGDIPHIPLSEVIILRVNSLDQLHDTRTALRDALGSWDDRMSSSWGTNEGATLIFEYTGIRYGFIQIWLCVDADDIPPGLIGENCHVEEHLITTKSLRVVCTN